MTETQGLLRNAPRRVFRDRREAGRVLADLLDGYRGARRRRPGVGPRRLPGCLGSGCRTGGSAGCVHRAQTGRPGHEEFAMGALASGGRVVVNDDVVRALRVRRSSCATSPNVKAGNCSGARPPIAAVAHR